MSALKTTVLRSAATLLAACFLTVPAWAQHGGGCACGHPQNAHPAWEIDLATPELQNAAAAQLTKWNSVVDVWDWSIGDGASGINGKNEIAFLTASQIYNLYGLYTPYGTLGIAFLSPISSFGQPSFNGCPMPAGTTCGTFAETDALLVSDFYEGWTTDPPGFDSYGPWSFGAIALHELGHTLGLHHNFSNLATMNYLDDSVVIYLSAADAAIARQHYPADAQALTDIGTYPFRYSTSSYEPILVAAPNSSFVAPGQPFTLRDFTLENPGSVTLSNVVLSVYLSTDKTVTAGDVLVGTLTWPSFSPNGWWDTSGWSFNVPAATPPGDYYIGAIATHSGSASDGVTYNNSWILDNKLKVTPTHTLTVAKAGSGDGRVTSSPAGIDCGADCSQVYPEGTLVVLTPKPGYGAVFAGWSGACTGPGSCVVTMDAARSVTALFSQSHSTCLPAKTLSCNGSDTWANYLGGSTNAKDYYGCPNTYYTSYDGPEYTYTFQAPVDSRVRLTLSGLSASLDVLVLDNVAAGCTAGTCLVSSSSYFSSPARSATFAAVGGHQYFVVVDGQYGATSNYTLQATCMGPTFADVPVTYWADRYIEALFNAGITTGCAESPKRFCPEDTVSRDQMAVFLVRAKKGSNFTPLAANGIFNDVPANHWAGGWIEQLYQEGATSGCASNPLRYCPDAKVTRAEMAVFLLRARYGSTYQPPTAYGYFDDVPAGHWAAPWIEELYDLGITTGCAEYRFCPDAQVTRAEMAVFLQRTFNLPLP